MASQPMEVTTDKVLTSSEIPSNDILFSAVQRLDFDAVKEALEKGCDPLSLNEDGDNVLSILASHLQKNEYMNERIITSLFSLFLDLPIYKDITFPNSLCKIYKSLLLKLAQDFHVNYEIVIPIISLILKSNIKVNSLEFQLPKLVGFSLFACIFKIPLIVDFQGYLIIQTMYNMSKLMSKINSLQKDKVLHQELFHILLSLAELKFSYSHMSINCPTPLTILVLLDQSTLKISTINLKVIENLYIKAGMNVGTSVLEIDEDYGSFSRDIKLIAKYKNKMKIPDILLLFLCRNDNYKYLISHYLSCWWGTPLSLLPFLPEMNSQIFSDLYDHLASFGQIPHGTLLHNIFNEMIENIYTTEFIDKSEYPDDVAEDFLENYEEYKKHKKTPLRLQELCKYTVRQSIAETASKPGKNLTEILRDLLPPLLHSAVIH